MRQEKWYAIVEPLLLGTPFELVGVECIGAGKHAVIRIYVDKQPGGINIDEITQLTRQLNVVLNVEDVVKGPYTLEVSSPGLDRPLFSPRHFQERVGEKISIKTREKRENRQNFKGTLVSAGEEEIKLEMDGQLLSFMYDDIDKAKVIPEVKFSK